ncbi:hypothetical protein BH11MYX2_BH11MYX2_25920 [soil metagenome]
MAKTQTPAKKPAATAPSLRKEKDAKSPADPKDPSKKNGVVAAKDAGAVKKNGAAKDAKAIAPKMAKAPAKGGKPTKARDEDGEGEGDAEEEEDDDFAIPKAKAAKGPGKPGPGAKKAGPTEIDLGDDDDAGFVAADTEDEDDFSLPPVKRASAAKDDADAAAVEAETRKSKRGGGGASRDGNSMRDKLIELGKAKGFVTYDEVNDHMPEDVVSTDQIDGWLSALGEHGIEVVDGSSKARGDGSLIDQPPKEGGPLGLGGEKDEKEEVDEDEEYAYSRTSDPVRMYLRKMGSVSLLTREGEVEIAKRIEDGERKMLQAVLNSTVAVEELIAIGERLRHGKVRVKDVVKDID